MCQKLYLKVARKLHFVVKKLANKCQKIIATWGKILNLQVVLLKLKKNIWHLLKSGLNDFWILLTTYYHIFVNIESITLTQTMLIDTMAIMYKSELWIKTEIYNDTKCGFITWRNKSTEYKELFCKRNLQLPGCFNRKKIYTGMYLFNL